MQSVVDATIAVQAVEFDYTRAMEYLLEVVQDLSLARDLDHVMRIVRHAARMLTGADGASFVLRDGDQCFYADEEAIGPLWKGLRFPMRVCISGWVMMNRMPAVIDDIFSDPRIPVDAYRSTFVRSLIMVPIRTTDPVGAIGNYWGRNYTPSLEQVRILQALADTTAVAIENAQLYGSLERRVRERTAALVAQNERVLMMSLTDDLTGLYNRRGFMVLAARQLRVARRAQGAAWVLVADVDGLKPVNDRMGHEAGDRLLRAAAEVLRASARELDIVARLGGDEFAIFGAGENPPTALVERVQAAIDLHNMRAGEGSRLSISMGIEYCGPICEISLEQLLAQADEAMYATKRKRSSRRMLMTK
ncbi:MAG TPA: sensor domain-containing diguanylate cyclase [Terracidiphilus sp.]|jgi:diguanylate cyclase (GGDEF)-like protein